MMNCTPEGKSISIYKLSLESLTFATHSPMILAWRGIITLIMTNRIRKMVNNKSCIKGQGHSVQVLRSQGYPNMDNNQLCLVCFREGYDDE